MSARQSTQPVTVVPIFAPMITPTAFVSFMMVKGVNKLRELGKKKEEEEAPADPEPSAEEKLLTEIRDLLKDK